MQMSFRCRWALCLTLSKFECANYEHVLVRKIDMSKQGLVKNTIDIELGLFFSMRSSGDALYTLD